VVDLKGLDRYSYCGHNACRCQLCSSARRENVKGTVLPTGNLSYLNI